MARWSVEDLRALCRGLGMEHTQDNGLGVEVFSSPCPGGVGWRVCIHSDGGIRCGTDVTGPQRYFAALTYSIEGAVAWLLRWAGIGFTAYIG